MAANGVVSSGMTGGYGLAMASPGRGTTIALLCITIVVTCATVTDAEMTPTSSEPSVSPVVIARSGDVTVSWRMVTRAPGVTIRLYAGGPGGFRLMTQGPAKLGTRSYSFVDDTTYAAPVMYQLRWVDPEGREEIVATIVRVDAEMAPSGVPAPSTERTGVADRQWPVPERESPSLPVDIRLASTADLFIPSPDVPPPRAEPCLHL